MNRILTYNKFDEMASSYFSFFLFKAMQKTGQEELILDNLSFWYNFIDRGYTTCGETGFASHDRSDCHAWSAHPAYFLLSSVCGIKPSGIGFNKVFIETYLGKLTSLKASIPHPNGRISVDYKKVNGEILGSILLLIGLGGIWKFRGQKMFLKEGENQLK